MYDSVLVPTDGSDGALKAARHAVALAELDSATVHVLNVVDSRWSGVPVDDLDEEIDLQIEGLRRHGEAAVDRIVGLATAADLPVETAILRGIPYDSIPEYAAASGIELIVMGTHGRTGVDRYLLGSVTERVVRTASPPVLTIRSADEHPPGDYDVIVVPTDGSEGAETAGTHAIDLAARVGARVHVLHVVDVTALAGFAEGPVPDRLIEGLYDHGEAVTGEIADRAADAGVDVETAVVEGSPTAAIRTYAADNAADLIAMGTQGRTGLGRFLIGSVAERLVRTAPSPVLTVRSTD